MKVPAAKLSFERLKEAWVEPQQILGGGFAVGQSVEADICTFRQPDLNASTSSIVFVC